MDSERHHPHRQFAMKIGRAFFGVIAKCAESRDHDHRCGADDRIISLASIFRAAHMIERVRFKTFI
jgi:Leu/Phe-tRNA-protein transferase